MRHVEPKDKPWLLLPLTIDYGIALDGKPAPEAGAKMNSGKGVDWFWTLRRDARGGHEAFVSLPDEIVVVMNALPATGLHGAKSVDSFVSVEKPHKTFTIFYQGGQATYHYGQENWNRTGGSPDFYVSKNGTVSFARTAPNQNPGDALCVQSSWANLADSIGFVTINLSRDPACMHLPEPGVRGRLSLYHVEKPAHGQRFVTVVFPDQDHVQTGANVSRIAAADHDGVITCLVRPYFVFANLSDHASRVPLPDGIGITGPVECQPKSIGILRASPDGKACTRLE